MNFSLHDQNAVVVGGARGIGAAICESFLEAGAEVLALDRDADALADLDARLPRITTAVADVSDLSSLEAAASGRAVDHLVVAAAIGSGRDASPFWKLQPDDWDRVLDVTLMGTVRSVHAFTPALLEGETKRKSILLLASVAGQIGSQTDPPYSAAKAAVINFAQCAAKDFAPLGIRVNALSPGMVRTELNRSVFEANRESVAQDFEEWGREKIARVAPLARWQEPKEFGAMAVYLAGPSARNITGQTLNIDGGQVMHS